MPPRRIVIIRHAEEHDTRGLDEQGRSDRHSLTIRGWQRAGALVGFIRSAQGGALRPGTVYASSVGPGSESRRPHQTVGPVTDWLQQHGGVCYNQAYAKTEPARMMADVLQRTGTVLVCWEHSRIPEAVAALPDPPPIPAKFPIGRYDLVWLFEREAAGWTFSQIDQDLLCGDSAG